MSTLQKCVKIYLLKKKFYEIVPLDYLGISNVMVKRIYKTIVQQQQQVVRLKRRMKKRNKILMMINPRKGMEALGPWEEVPWTNQELGNFNTIVDRGSFKLNENHFLTVQKLKYLILICATFNMLFVRINNHLKTKMNSCYYLKLLNYSASITVFCMYLNIKKRTYIC